MMKSSIYLFAVSALASPLICVSAKEGSTLAFVSNPSQHKEHQRYHGRHTSLHSMANNGDVYAAVHRKEHEMKGVNQQHVSLSDPVRMAIGYVVESEPPLRLAKALRRTYDDPTNPESENYRDPTQQDTDRAQKLLDNGMKDAVMRRGSFIVDIKRRSLSRPGETFARYDDAGYVMRDFNVCTGKQQGYLKFSTPFPFFPF
jgi:hypothetical protein